MLKNEPWSLRNAQFLSPFYMNFSFDSMDCARNHRPATFLGRSSWPTSSANLYRLMNFCRGNITNRVVATRWCAETKRSVFRFPPKKTRSIEVYKHGVIRLGQGWNLKMIFIYRILSHHPSKCTIKSISKYTLFTVYKHDW